MVVLSRRVRGIEIVVVDYYTKNKNNNIIGRGKWVLVGWINIIE